MLDIRVIRENPEEVKARLKPRSGDAWKLVDDVLACDEARRNAETEKQALQSERNATSKQIGMLKKKGEDTSSIEARVREIGDRIRELDRVAEENAAQLTSLLMNIPNLPHLGGRPPGTCPDQLPAEYADRGKRLSGSGRSFCGEKGVHGRHRPAS